MTPGGLSTIREMVPVSVYIKRVKDIRHMTASISNLSTIAADLNAAGKTVKVTVLKSAATRTRRSALTKTNSSGRSGLGSHDTEKGSYVATGDIAIGAGRMGTLNPVNSLGRQWVGDKSANAARAAAQYAADRRAAARDRLGL